MKLSETIKKIRLSLCLEQQEFAKLVGVSLSAICHYEKGARRPRLPIVRRIIEVAKKNKIKVTLEDFLEE